MFLPGDSARVSAGGFGAHICHATIVSDLLATNITRCYAMIVSALLDPTDYRHNEPDGRFNASKTKASGTPQIAGTMSRERRINA